MKTTIYKCNHCSEPTEQYGVSLSEKGDVMYIGYVCMKEGCTRYGLISVTANKQEIEEG